MKIKKIIKQISPKDLSKLLEDYVMVILIIKKKSKNQNSYLY